MPQFLQTHSTLHPTWAGRTFGGSNASRARLVVEALLATCLRKRKAWRQVEELQLQKRNPPRVLLSRHSSMPHLEMPRHPGIHVLPHLAARAIATLLHLRPSFSTDAHLFLEPDPRLHGEFVPTPHHTMHQSRAPPRTQVGD